MRRVGKLPKSEDAKFLYKRLIDLDLTVRELAKEAGITEMCMSKILSFKITSRRVAKLLEQRLGLEDGWFEKRWRERKDEYKA